MSAATFLARLDDLPPNRFHWRLLAASGLGWTFDAMDLLLIGFLLVPIRSEFGLDAVRTGLIAIAGLAGTALGAAIAGRIADRSGRRTVAQVTLVLFSIGSLLSAVAPSFELLLAARLIGGLGLGGELPVIPTLVVEFAPRQLRGRIGVLLGAFWALGAIAAGAIALVALPPLGVTGGTGGIGWRGALIAGALPALAVIVLRRFVPESPRYLAERGRAAEADAIVRRVEREGGGALITIARPVAPPRSGTMRLGDLLAPRYRRRTALVWIVWTGALFATSGTFVLGPALLADRGLPVAHANLLFFVSTLAQLPGIGVAAWLVEQIGRRATLALFLLGTAAAGVGFGIVGTGAETPTGALLGFASILSFFVLGVFSVITVFAAELYPTALRGTGSGIAAGIGRLGAVAALALVGGMAAAGSGAAAGFAAVLLILVAGAVLLLGEEPRGRSLEDIAPAV